MRTLQSEVLMARKAKTSLEAKLCILTLGTLFVVLLGVGHMAMSEYRYTLMEERIQSYDAVAHSLAFSASQLVEDRNEHLTDTVSAHVKNSRMDLEYIVIADNQGRTVFAESKNLPKKTNIKGMQWWAVVRRIMGYGNVSPENIHSVSVPVMIGNDKSGTLTAGFNLSSAQEMIDAVQSKVLLGLSLGLLVGTIFAFIMGRSMSGALRNLITGAKAVSAGDLNFRITTKSIDEIGQLAEAFNAMVENLANNQELLIERANTDCLTGLYNHRYFQEKLSSEINRASRYNHNLSLLMIDIDFFKGFNDEYGHPVGDAALRDLAQILIKNVRETDIAFRYGGEEFSVILPETSIEDAKVTAERIRQEVENHKFIDGEGQEHSLTVSIGVASYPDHCSSRASLLLAADVALYQAKSLGRNRVTIYDMDKSDLPQADPRKLYILLNAHDMPTIEALAEAVDAKLKLPSGHSRSVAQLASAVAAKMGMPEAECTSIYLASLLRDIGQIAIPDAILAKTRPLKKAEKSIVATHPSLGHAIVQKAPHLSTMLPAILHHHEHYDGTGYPSHLAGEEIPLAARIIAAADAYESMIIPRPHREPKTPAEARKELVELSSSQFDPKVVQALLDVLATNAEKDKAA